MMNGDCLQIIARLPLVKAILVPFTPTPTPVAHSRVYIKVKKMSRLHTFV